VPDTVHHIEQQGAAVTTTDKLAPEESTRLAEFFGTLGRELVGTRSVDEVLTLISRRAYESIPSAEHVAISRGRRGRFETIAATSDVPPRVDQLQYDAGTGPCVDAILDDTVFRVGELATSDRWPDFGRQAAERYGIHSMLAVRMYLEDDDLLAGLNIYSSSVDAFDASDQTVATLLATHGALALTAANRQDKVENLERALETSRRIGAAVGIVMASRKVTYEQGFDLLRIVSQSSHRKLADVADDVMLTGVVDLPPTPEPRQRT
jgi:GAF domain-containing protein